MTDRRGVRVGSFTTELTLAVELRDTLTGGPPRDRPRVAVANADHDFVRNPSGYHVLADLPPDPPTLDVVVESEAYLREERTVDRSSLGETPLVAIDLVPGPAYPFGGGVTLVRGIVKEGDDPVGGATVSFVEGDDEVRTTPEGEFALPITDFGSDDVTTRSDGTAGGSNGGNGNPGNGPNGGTGGQNGGDGGTNGDGNGSGTRIIEPGGTEPTIRATHPDGRTTEETVTLPVGRTTSVSLVF